MKLKNRCLAAVLCMAMLGSSAVGFAADNTSSAFTTDFENVGDEWNFGSSADVVGDEYGRSLKLTGKNSFVYVNKGNFRDIYAYAEIKEIKGENGYVGLAVRTTDNGRYEVRFDIESKSVKLLRADGKDEKILASKDTDVYGGNFTLGISAKDNMISAYIGDAQILSVIDDNAIESGGVAILSNTAEITVDRVAAYQNDKLFYEDYESGKLISSTDGTVTMVPVSNESGSEFVIGEKSGKGVMTATSKSAIARAVYKTDMLKNKKSNAVIARIRSNGWSMSAEEGGVGVFSHYSAINRTYKMTVENGFVVMYKQSIAETTELGRAASASAFDEEEFAEIAFETLENADGTVTLKGYVNGKLVVTAIDENDTFAGGGGFGIEKSGNLEIYVDDLSVEEVDPHLTLEAYYAENEVKPELSVEVAGVKYTPSVKPSVKDNELIMPVSDMAKIIGAKYTKTNNSATVSRDGLTVSITAGSDTVKINGTDDKMKRIAYIENDEIMASSNYIAGMFGAIHSYDKEKELVSISYDETVLKDTKIYAMNGNVFALGKSGLNFRYAKVSGVDGHYRALENKNQKPMYKAYFTDKKNADANTLKGEPAKGYYGTNWVLSECRESSLEAELVSADMDMNRGRLTLKYSASRADATVYVDFKDGKLEFGTEITNKCDDPLQFVTTSSEWNYCYSTANTLLLPTSYTFVEFDSVSWYRWDEPQTAMDGFIVDGDSGVMTTYHLQHEQKDGDDEWIRGTTSQIYSGEIGRSIRYYAGPYLFLKKGESAKSVPVVVAAHNDMRSATDDYVKSCYPNIKKVREKLLNDQDRENIPKSNLIHLGTIGNKYNDIAKFVEKAPGTSMFHMTAVLGQSNTQYGYWDAFPNYFPPYVGQGSSSVNASAEERNRIAEEEFLALIRKMRAEGHSYLPRQSLFYGTEDSRLDKQLKEEGNPNGLADEALVRFDGQAQRAVWGVPGWLYSPASKRMMQFFNETLDKWQENGCTLFFSNVIAVMTPMKHPYDFHEDAERPDYSFDYQARLMRLHGERAPLFTEGTSVGRLPYQAGFMTDARWDPRTDESILTAGSIRVRYDVMAMIFSEYARIFPHNVSDENQTSYRALTFSLLHNWGLKMRYNIGTQPSDDNARWVRGQAILGELVMDKLYGARLEDEIDYTKHELVANYSGNTVTGTLDNTPIVKEDRTISKEGFEFKSADGNVTAGVYDRLNGHKLEQSTLLLFEKTSNGGQKIYAPVTDRNITLRVPTGSLKKPELVAHWADGRVTKLKGVWDGENMNFTYPQFPLSDGDDVEIQGGATIQMSKIIPYVELVEGNQSVITTIENKVSLTPSLPFKQYSDIKKVPNSVNGSVRIENPSGRNLDGKITIKGSYFGKTINTECVVKTSDKESAVSFKLEKDPFSTDTGANLYIEASGLGNAEITEDSFGVTKQDLSMITPNSEIAKNYDIKFEWNAAQGDLPDGFAFDTSSGKTENKYGEALSITKENGAVKIDGDKLMIAGLAETNQKFYAEMLIRFTDLSKYVYSNSMQNDVLTINNGTSMPIRLKYHTFDNCLVLTGKLNGKDVITEQYDEEVKLGEWMHVIIEYDHNVQKLTVNGNAVQSEFAGNYGATDGTVTLGGNMSFDIGYIKIGVEKN